MHMYEGLFWLILTVMLEARGEPPLGQKHVTKVILNRASDNNTPISSIVLAKDQFSCYNNGIINAVVTLKSELSHIPKVTKQVVNAVDEWKKGHTLSGATHYYAPKKVKKKPRWSKKMVVVTKTGGHVFLKK